jgi:uncharacterized membrane protein YgdD (TMEM256/DUF423 family)
MRTYLALGGIFGFLAVAIGAFGAHALRDTLEAHNTTAVYQTGVQYHVTHALALLLIALLLGQFPNAKPLRAAGGLFAVGIIIFSGSLYALALSGIRIFGAITPLGGLCFLAGWVCITLAGIQSRSR